MGVPGSGDRKFAAAPHGGAGRDGIETLAFAEFASSTGTAPGVSSTPQNASKMNKFQDSKNSIIMSKMVSKGGSKNAGNSKI